MTLFRKIATAFYWMLDTEKSPLDFVKSPNGFKGALAFEGPLPQPMKPPVITAHVFYPDFANQLMTALAKLPPETKLFATTPSEEIRRDLEALLKISGNPHEVRLTPNVGRNFAPLLVEFSKELLEEESFIHIHSKRSLHSPEIAKDWVDRNTNLLLTRDGIHRIQSLSDANPKLGLVCVDASDLVRGINFRWGRSLKIAKRIFAHLPGFEHVKWAGRLFFPVGGMFWVKTDAIRPMLEHNWMYEMFSAESGQRDGTLQHAIERMFGQLCLSRNFEAASLNHLSDQFSIITFAK
jgi:lipopolysaccharide biosynthesis protein